MSNTVLTSFAEPDAVFRRRGATPDDTEEPPAINYLLDQTFDTWPLGVVTTSAWKTNMNGSNIAAAEAARHEIKTNPDLGGRMVDLTLLAGVYGSAGGAVCAIPYPRKDLDTFFEIRWMFHPNPGEPFDFGKGGKIPGPAGVKPGLSLTYPSGCKTITDEGWSQRSMWGSTDTHAHLEYLYGYDSSAAGHNCGEPGYWHDPHTSALTADTIAPTPGVWQTKRVRARLNDVGLANGISECWHTNDTAPFDPAPWPDDRLVWRRTNRQQRTRADVLTDGICWSWFYGGSSSDWAPATDQHIWIDYVKAWTM